MANIQRLGLREIPGMEHLGSGTGWFQEQLVGMLGEAPMFAEFTMEEIQNLAGFMEVYRVPPGTVVIHEGDPGDYMLVLIEGEVIITKEDSAHFDKSIAVVGAGKTLGEMSMIDGEPRFATCTASETTTFAVLTRSGLLRITQDLPLLGVKILTQLVKLLSQRLRQISVRLVDLLT